MRRWNADAERRSLPPASTATRSALSGMVLGFGSLARRRPDEDDRVRAQRRILTLSALCALAPSVVLALIPSMILGLPLVPYHLTMAALILLPLGFGYAIVRHDLMQIDIVIRRAIAALFAVIALAALSLLVILPIDRIAPGFPGPWAIATVVFGGLLGPPIWALSRGAVEQLLAPTLTRSRRVLDGVDRNIRQGGNDTVAVAALIEQAICQSIGTRWARLLVRMPSDAPVFRSVADPLRTVDMPTLARMLAARTWGIDDADVARRGALGEWARIGALTGESPALLVPVLLRGDIIAILAVSSPNAARGLDGPEREALALLADHFALALDHARIGEELAAESKDATALLAASSHLTAGLGDRASLPHRVVESLLSLRDVRGASLFLREGESDLFLAASAGAPLPCALPPDPNRALFSSDPAPHAWIPLTVGSAAFGALSLCWQAGHVVKESDRGRLSIYADGAALALEHALLYERARDQAERDAVTGLFNHRAFHARLESTLGEIVSVDSADMSAESLSLLLVDLADFKLFNDTHGHQAGDQVLRSVADMLRSCSRASDSAARLGGDEFALLLPHAGSNVAIEVAERLADLATTSGLMTADGRVLPIRLSVGTATYPDDAATANGLLTCSDERMYAAKRAGVSVARPIHTPESESAIGRFGLIESLVAMVDNRDRYTGEHSDQVATYACAIAREIGLSHETIETIRLAGLLHDVGKIGVPDKILRKPGALTEDEVDMMRRHVELSDVLLTVVTKDHDLIDAVRYHHERWDGHGYPRGIAGHDVTLPGRIMILADAVSAMHMDRPYRKGLPWSVIAEELRQGSSTQFDPELIEPALCVLRPYLDTKESEAGSPVQPPASPHRRIVGLADAATLSSPFHATGSAYDAISTS